jgi:hypothetical protein
MSYQDYSHPTNTIWDKFLTAQERMCEVIHVRGLTQETESLRSEMEAKARELQGYLLHDYQQRMLGMQDEIFYFPRSSLQFDMTNISTPHVASSFSIRYYDRRAKRTHFLQRFFEAIGRTYTGAIDVQPTYLATHHLRMQIAAGQRLGKSLSVEWYQCYQQQQIRVFGFCGGQGLDLEPDYELTYPRSKRAILQGLALGED